MIHVNLDAINAQITNSKKNRTSRTVRTIYQR